MAIDPTQVGETVGPPLTDPLPLLADGSAARSVTLAYRGEGGDLFLVMVKNVFFTLITLGIFAPWARVARRRYLWRQVEVDGQRMDFTGTGKELFIGYLKVVAGYLGLVLLPQLVRRASPGLGGALQIAGFATLGVLLPYALYWSRRYLLARTRWRGIRFGLAGDAGAFAKIWVKGAVLTVLTLGLYGPVFANNIHRAIVNDTRFGTGAFRYDGPNRQAFKIAIKGLLLSIITLGIYSFWYMAEMQRFRAAHTHFDRATARLDVTGGLLFKLMMVNLFGNLLTLGVAIPWTMTYTLRTLLERISFEGAIDFAAVSQRVATDGDGAGDMLAGALGVELGL